jgi:enterochelin esterase-like enzyme
MITSRFGLIFKRDRTAIFGTSAGGELALALGIRHPNIYGAILCASPGAGYKPSEGMPAKIPPTYLVAGMQEPFFLENAMRWANALNEAGSEVVMKVREGSHDNTLWKAEFPLMAAWAFSRSSNSTITL